jgi:hypothetical protein
MSPPARSRAGRYLDLVVKLLPASRSDWGRAMRAELATIDSSAERWRFVLGCTRVALLPNARTQAAGRSLGAAGAVGLVLGAEFALVRTIGPFVPLVGVLALLAWLGRRRSYFGPVRPDCATRAARACGYALVGACLLAAVVAAGVSDLLRPDSLRWGTPFALLLTLVAAACLAMTAHSSRLGRAGLVSGIAAGLVAGAAGFVVLPFERIGTPLADRLPGHGTWLALTVFVAPAAAALLTGRRTRRAEQAVMAALCAGASAALLVALAGLSAIVLLPDRVPNIVGPVMPPGATAAQRQLENSIEASDPYFGLLLFGALLGAVLWVMARPPRRAGTTVALVLLGGVPAFVLAASATGFPGATAITTAATMVLIGAVVTARPAAPA